MADDKPDASRKLIILGVAAGAVLICLVAVASVLIWSYLDTSAQTQELKLKFADNGTVSDEQLAQTKSVLQDRFKELGISASVNAERDAQGNALVLIKYGNLPRDYVVSTATAPGIFEIRVQTQDNESEHILYGDEIKHVSDPGQAPGPKGSEAWMVAVELTPSGAGKFQSACIETGAVKDPESHKIMMLLDLDTLHTAPLSPELARTVNMRPVEMLVIMTGTGDPGKAQAEKLVAILRSGALPARLVVVD